MKGPKWKTFERRVADIESALIGCGALVKSPDYLPDVSGKIGRKRQVDATIRYPLGSTSLLIVIECRLHKPRQNVKWIEELATKRKRVGADILIAVSSSGFTDAAENLAAQEGIKICVLEELTQDSIKRFVDICYVAVTRPHYHDITLEYISESNLHIQPSSEMRELIVSGIVALSFDRKHNIEMNAVLSATFESATKHFGANMTQRLAEFTDRSLQNEAHLVVNGMLVSFSDDSWYCLTDGGMAKVKGIEVSLKIVLTFEYVEMTRGHVYSKAGKALHVSAAGDYEGKPLEISFRLDKNGA